MTVEICSGKDLNVVLKPGETGSGKGTFFFRAREYVFSLLPSPFGIVHHNARKTARLPNHAVVIAAPNLSDRLLL